MAQQHMHATSQTQTSPAHSQKVGPRAALLVPVPGGIPKIRKKRERKQMSVAHRLRIQKIYGCSKGRHLGRMCVCVYVCEACPQPCLRSVHLMAFPIVYPVESPCEHPHAFAITPRWCLDTRGRDCNGSLLFVIFVFARIG